MSRLSPSLVALVLMFSSTLLAQSSDPVVAEVNGSKITKSELYKYHQNNLSFVQVIRK